MTDAEIREKLLKIDPPSLNEDGEWWGAAIATARRAIEALTLVEAEEVLFKAGWGAVVESARELRGASECKACHGRGYV